MNWHTVIRDTAVIAWLVAAIVATAVIVPALAVGAYIAAGGAVVALWWLSAAALAVAGEPHLYTPPYHTWLPYGEDTVPTAPMAPARVYTPQRPPAVRLVAVGGAW